MVDLITILSFNFKLCHAQFLYDLQAEVLRLPPKISLRYAQLDWKGIPLVFLREGRSQPKTKKISSSREHHQVYASRRKEVFEIRNVIHYVYIRSTVVLFKTTGQLKELGDSMDFPEVRNSNFGSPGTT